MRAIINNILSPFTTLGSIFPPDVDLFEIKHEIRLAVRRALSGTKPVEKPYLINVCGLPAAGKSHVCKQIKTEHPELLYISFDALMEDLPVYLGEHLRDRQKSFERWELPARFVGYQLLKQAVKHKLPILFEHSNANPLHIALYEKIKQAGYSVDIRYIAADINLVLPRLAERERYFSPQKAVEREETLKKLLPELKKTATHFEILPPWTENNPL